MISKVVRVGSVVDTTNVYTEKVEINTTSNNFNSNTIDSIRQGTLDCLIPE